MAGMFPMNHLHRQQESARSEHARVGGGLWCRQGGAHHFVGAPADQPTCFIILKVGCCHFSRQRSIAGRRGEVLRT